MGWEERGSAAAPSPTQTWGKEKRLQAPGEGARRQAEFWLGTDGS